MNRRLRRYFLCSLLLNVLLVGMISGHFFSRIYPPHKPTRAQAAMKALPDDRRAFIDEQMKRITSRNLESDKASKPMRLNAVRAMRAEQFDREAYLKAMKEMFAERDRRRDETVAWVADLSQKLNKEERVALSRQLEERFRQQRKARLKKP